MKNNIEPHNDNNIPNGYWICYYLNGNISSEGLYLNGEFNGLWKWYYANGNLMDKDYFI